MEYTAKLSDGSEVKLDADHEPSQEEILAAVQEQPAPEPMSAAKAFGIGAASAAVPTLAGAGGAKLGFMAGEAIAPQFTPISGLVGLAIGALVSSVAAGKLQKKALEKLSPETAKKVEQLQAQAEKEQPLATGAGEFLPAAATFKIDPRQGIKGAIGLSKVIKGTANLEELQAAKATATQLGMGVGFGVAAPLLEGEKPTAKGIGVSALMAMVLGEPRMKALRPHAAGGAEPPAEAETPATPPPTPEPAAPGAAPITGPEAVQPSPVEPGAIDLKLAPDVQGAVAQGKADIAFRARQASARIREIIERKAAGVEREGDAERKAAADLAIGAETIKPVAPLTSKALSDQSSLNFEKPPTKAPEVPKGAKTPAKEEKAAAPAKPEEPAPSEFLVAASFTHPETGEITTGANHIEAAQEQGVNAPLERTARETPEFGYEAEDEFGNTRYVTREEGEKIARANGQLIREPITGKLHSDEVRFVKSKAELDAIPVMVTREMNQALADLGYPKEVRNKMKPEEAQAILAKGETYAIHSKAAEILRNVQQPQKPEEGAGEVPAAAAGKEAGAGGGELPQKAHELSADQVAEIPPEKFKAYRDELGKDTEARQFELAKTTPIDELQKHLKDAGAEMAKAQKKAQAMDVQKDPEAAQKALDNFNAAATKVQFFNEVLQRVPKEAKAADVAERKTALIEQAMQLGRTRKLSAEQRSMISQGIEAVRKGDAAPIEAAIESAKKAEKVKGEELPKGYAGKSRFDRETELVGDDLLSWIVNNMKLLSKSAAKKLWGKEKFEKNKSLWDDAPSYFGSQDKRTPHHNIIYSEKGSTPDNVAKQAYAAGKLKTGNTEKELWPAIAEASAKRANAEETAAKETAVADVKAQQDSDWAAASSKGKIELTTEDVAIGDRIEVGGETLKVAGREPTGEVHLRGGNKFGDQVLSEGEKIYVDKHTPTEAKEAEFLTPAEEAKAEPEKPIEEEPKGLPKPPKYKVTKPPEGASEAERKAHLDKEFEALSADRERYDRELKAFDESIPANKGIVLKEKVGNFFRAITKDPQGGWRSTSFTKLYKDDPRYAPWGHERYKTRYEALKEHAQNAEVVDHLPEVMTEAEIKSKQGKPEGEPSSVEAIAAAKEKYGNEKVIAGLQKWNENFGGEPRSEGAKAAQLSLFAKALLKEDPRALEAIGEPAKPAEEQTAAKEYKPITQSDRDFGESLAKKYGSPVSPTVPATEPLESWARFSNMLERAADKSKDGAELDQILSSAAGLGEESRIAWAVANNPHASDETFSKAKANTALRRMTTDENIASLDSRRAELRKALKTPKGGDVFGKEDMPFNLTAERATGPKAAKPVEQAEELFSAAPKAKEEPAPEAPKPKLEERPLTKAEAEEFTELSKIAAAARDKGGPPLTSEQSKRYDELSAIAGQKEFQGLTGEQADQVANEKVAQEKLDAQNKIIEQNKKIEEEAATNPKPTDTPVAPPDTRKPMEILNEAKKVKITAPKEATFLRATDNKGRTSLLSVKEVNKGANLYQGASIKKLEAGTIGRDKKFIPLKGAVEIKDATPRKFSEGPGAASPSDFPEESPLKTLTQVLKDWGEISPEVPFRERLKEGIDIAKRWAEGKDAATGALGKAKAAGEALIDAYAHPPKWTDFKAAIGRWVWADSTTALEVREFQKQIGKTMPNKLRQEAITNWIQAHGDEAVLRARADASGPRFKRGYEEALKLTPAEKTLAEQIGTYFENRLEEGIQSGILRSAVEDYVTQVWKANPQEGAKLVNSLFGGELNPSFKFALKRIFEHYFEGEQAGYVPKNKGIGYLLSVYDLAFNRAISARGFIKELHEGTAADGKPIVMISKPSVRAVPTGEDVPEAFLLKANQRPKEAVTEDGRPYLAINHWALKGWKWAMTGIGGEKVPVTGQQELPGPHLAPTARTEAPVFVEGDMLVHPDHFKHLENILTRSRIAGHPIGRLLLKGSALAKQTKLSLSPFHWTQETVHAMAHKVFPTNLPEIDPHHPVLKSLMEHGLMLQDPRAMELFSEGAAGGGLTAKIPGLGKLQTWFNDYLFRDYIPKLKAKMAMEALKRNREVYAKKVQDGKITDDQLIALTANESNAAFGELNYRMLGRNQTTQDLMRLGLLAPDFLEARARFLGQAFKPYGREQLMAFARMGGVLFVGTRILNQLLDGDMHMDKPLSVVAGGKEYRLRTIIGDALHLFSDPRNFWYNRMSPITRTGIEYLTSRDDRGIKIQGWQHLTEMAKWFAPISVQGLLPGGRKDIGLGAQAITSMGVAITQANAQRRLYEVADKWMETNKDPAIRERYERFKAETHVDSPYTPLRHALQRDDLKDARKEYDKLRETRKTAQIRDTMATVRPFTGSAKSEIKFKKSLTPEQMKLYNEAVKERKDLYQKFQKMLRGEK